jgi:hypothetical protein
MKKAFIIFITIVGLALMSCNVKTTVGEGQGCIGHWDSITFYNGGTAIAGPYKNVEVKCRITTNTKLVGNGISFYMYDVYKGGKLINSIMDSESLSCVIDYDN